jgi:hypothetical protein
MQETKEKYVVCKRYREIKGGEDAQFSIEVTCGETTRYGDAAECEYGEVHYKKDEGVAGMVGLNINKLPQYVRDLIELKEATDPTFSRFVDCDYTEIFFDILNQRRNNPEHSIILSMVGGQGSGKSLSAITMACYVDPNFSADRIYFNYNTLVYGRQDLKDNSCVIVDEQSQTFGLDAHRIMTVLQNLKEQLRKRGISFIFCSPTLYEEAKSSMFIIETIYIDEDMQEVVAALKTREELTLGHIRIPHPLKPIDEQGGLATPELIKVYQEKKDAHLETVLGRDAKDQVLESAEEVMKHKMFLRAEAVYLKRYGYIPQGSLQQLINMIFPEFNAGVMSGEIAGRVRLIKEMSGQWELSGHSTNKKSEAAAKSKKRTKK